MKVPYDPGHFLRGFASDNFASVHPRILDRIGEYNSGHAQAYGEDDVTRNARAAFSRILGREVAAYFVFNGTAANNLSLKPFARSYGAVICSDVAHMFNDESTAPECMLGMRLIPIKSTNGKIPTAALQEALGKGHGIHAARPTAVTLTQPTELGTVYSVEELSGIVDLAHAHGLGVHVDGARIGCAVASMGISLKQMIADTGVDVLSFGGTKQGMLVGEAVVFLRPSLGEEFPYWQKHSMQLASKMRFISAQFEALLDQDLWIENCRHANLMAQSLLAGVREISWVKVLYPVQSNAVFARIPPKLIQPIQKESFFWPWDESAGIVRWMCAFDTEPEDVSCFINTLMSVGASMGDCC
jgi:threonine aldolase